MQLIHPVTLKKIELKDVKKVYGVEGEVFDLYQSDDSKITEIQSNFYSTVRFPSYENKESFAHILDKAKKSLWLKKLDEEIPFGAIVLEAGCGTGQLSIALSRFNRSIHAIDISVGSLITASSFIVRNHIKNVNLYRMNIHKMAFENEIFDIIISNGVIHHMKNPYLAFRDLIKKLKKGGYIILGLYHKYSRLFHYFRRFLVNNFGLSKNLLDPRFKQITSEEKISSWFLDQYKNPHESSHTFNEVISWFQKNNIEVINCLPFDFDVNQKILHKNIDSQIYEYRKNKFFLFLKELSAIFNYQQIMDGGFFVVIGKKN